MKDKDIDDLIINGENVIINVHNGRITVASEVKDKKRILQILAAATLEVDKLVEKESKYSDILDNLKDDDDKGTMH